MAILQKLRYLSVLLLSSCASLLIEDPIENNIAPIRTNTNQLQIEELVSNRLGQECRTPDQKTNCSCVRKQHLLTKQAKDLSNSMYASFSTAITQQRPSAYLN